MKIVYISRSIIPSRTANSINVMKMCESFANLGYEVTLLAPWTKKLEEKGVKDIFNYYGVKENFILKKLFSPNIKYLKKRIYSLRCLNQVKKIQPDFVYGRNDMYSFYLTQKNGFKTLFEQHEPFRENDFEHRMFKEFLKIKNDKIKVITISNKLREIYSQRYHIKQEAILVAQSATGLFNHQELPVASERFSKNTINVGYIGSLFKGRGIETIIELAREFSKINFHVIGGKKEDILYWEDKAKDLQNLTFYGFINPKETYKYRNMCDILVAPYQGEKNGNRNSDYMSPIKIFEYMASKKAIICSDLPAIRESISENHAVFVNGDEISEWKKALESLITHPEKIELLAKNAYNYCLENFTYEARCTKILEALK